MRSSFYLASTPYHLLLSLADAERAARPASVFFFGAFPAAPAYFAALKAAPPLLPSLNIEGITGEAKSLNLRREGLRCLSRSAALRESDRVIVFNDRHDLSQRALAIAAQREGVTRACYEDGSSLYTSWLAPAVGFASRFRKRLFTARHWQPVRVPGTHSLVQELRVLRPDAVRAELRDRALPLDLTLLASPVLRTYGDRLLQELQQRDPCLAAPECPAQLLTPPLAGAAVWLEQARRRVDPALPVAIKFHPRSSARDTPSTSTGEVEISRHLPLELLLLRWGRAPQRLIGDGDSTVLLSARLFDRTARVIGLCLQGLPPHAEAYERLDIELHPVAAS